MLRGKDTILVVLFIYFFAKNVQSQSQNEKISDKPALKEQSTEKPSVLQKC